MLCGRSLAEHEREIAKECLVRSLEIFDRAILRILHPQLNVDHGHAASIALGPIEERLAFFLCLLCLLLGLFGVLGPVLLMKELDDRLLFVGETELLGVAIKFVTADRDSRPKWPAELVSWLLVGRVLCGRRFSLGLRLSKSPLTDCARIAEFRRKLRAQLRLQ